MNNLLTIWAFSVFLAHSLGPGLPSMPGMPVQDPALQGLFTAEKGAGAGEKWRSPSLN